MVLLIFLLILFIAIIILAVQDKQRFDCEDCAMRHECRKLGKPLCKM